ncbi:MAG: GIY-YIG nuclease family protein, partial [Oscillospiraceae bacterium]|nr:GIY-YIG nuclease family protein [Oscillospiraceae bacterium]
HLSWNHLLKSDGSIVKDKEKTCRIRSRFSRRKGFQSRCHRASGLVLCLLYKIPNGLQNKEVTLMKPSEAANHYAYMLRCADGTIYSGYTTDPTRRAAVHNSGRGAKYTRSRLPVELVFSECFPTKSEALKREAALKKLAHAEKLSLISLTI